MENQVGLGLAVRTWKNIPTKEIHTTSTLSILTIFFSSLSVDRKYLAGPRVGAGVRVTFVAKAMLGLGLGSG